MKRIRLSKKSKSRPYKYALVDDADFEWLDSFNWSASLESRGTKWYAIRWITVEGKRVKVRMHREILGLPPGVMTDDETIGDHLDHDGLNNQRKNLRRTTQAINMLSSPGWMAQQRRKKEEPYL